MRARPSARCRAVHSAVPLHRARLSALQVVASAQDLNGRRTTRVSLLPRPPVLSLTGRTAGHDEYRRSLVARIVAMGAYWEVAGNSYGSCLQVSPAGRVARLVEEDGVLVATGETTISDQDVFAMIDSGRR